LTLVKTGNCRDVISVKLGNGLAADYNWHSPEPIPESNLTGSRTTTTANPSQRLRYQ
jgi:hypothetical protein